MIYVIIYLVGCIIAGYTLITWCLREKDLLVEDLPIVIIFTIGSWITVGSMCFYYLCNYISTNVNGNKVLIKHKKK